MCAFKRLCEIDYIYLAFSAEPLHTSKIKARVVNAASSAAGVAVGNGRVECLQAAASALRLCQQIKYFCLSVSEH